jgi:hypothetical protein
VHKSVLRDNFDAGEKSGVGGIFSVTEIGGGFLDDGVRTTGIGRASDLISSTNSLADKIRFFMTVVMICFQSSIGSWTMSLITNCVPKEGSRNAPLLGHPRLGGDVHIQTMTLSTPASDNPRWDAGPQLEVPRSTFPTKANMVFSLH